MKILISTGIFPPAIGGPSEYAKRLADAFREKGHMVEVATFTTEHRLPTGIRHIWFFAKIFFKVVRADFVIALDTFSVGFPSVLAAWLLRKKIIVRTGGDFVWEQHVERTKEKILFREFYKTRMQQLSAKEKLIMRITKFTLHHSSVVVFSTIWQGTIWQKPYELSKVRKIKIIENYYGPKEPGEVPSEKRFTASTRSLVWKNQDTLERSFKRALHDVPDIVLDTKNLPYKSFIEKVKNTYAVILVSLGDISPNMIMDAIRFKKPFILTRENGIASRIGNLGITVDPLNETEITEAIKKLSTTEAYEAELSKLQEFTFVHTYADIANEFIDLFNQI